MKKYSKAVSEMYSQLKKKGARPMEKYMGRLAKVGCVGLSTLWLNYAELEVVGYSCKESEDEAFLIVDASQHGGWSEPGSHDVVFKRCKWYRYANISESID